MNLKITRRGAIRAFIVSALAACPFVVRSLRKTDAPPLGQVAQILQGLVDTGKTNVSLKTAYDALDAFIFQRDQWLSCRSFTADALIVLDIFKGEGEKEPICLELEENLSFTSNEKEPPLQNGKLVRAYELTGTTGQRWAYTFDNQLKPTFNNCGYSVKLVAPVLHSLLSMPHEIFGAFWHSSYEGILHGFVPLAPVAANADTFCLRGENAEIFIRDGFLTQVSFLNGENGNVSMAFNNYVPVGKSDAGLIYLPTQYERLQSESSSRKKTVCRASLKNLVADVVPYRQ
ncbi:hypothetical protein FACS1894170_13250 [Planctomycetales bacterium]|nr:hypothetical protein FACS1894170_13250 [Planctomycetales bacterium]